ncbi:MAG: cofactor-independent phosphoglycerate mutase [Oscillospiraceae bacterium]|nr:cofactor-independent phosphoglycerate mutase [Oscillospiraceae bacterium]
MKYFILVPDGCADWPVAALGGKTPLEAAGLTKLNEWAKVSEIGLVRTIPQGVEPGSEAGNLSILGYDPAVCLTGRAPLEAAAMGLPMKENDTAFRASLVTLEGSGRYEDLVMKDHSAGEICDEDAQVFLRFIDTELGGEGLRFVPGVSYRGLLISHKLQAAGKIMEPHNILGKPIGGVLPSGQILDLMIKSHELLKNHPLNKDREARGDNPANAIWIWGQGKKLTLPSLKAKYGVKGCMIAAVNLLKGIGVCAGLSAPAIPGATGTLHTNYQGKAAAAIDAFQNGSDFVFVHVEAPDECTHIGDMDGKLQSLRQIDQKVFQPVAEYLQDTGEPYRILVLPDHKTLLETQTHNAEPVPFMLFDSENPQPADESKTFSETCGAKGRLFESGGELTDRFFGERIDIT